MYLFFLHWSQYAGSSRLLVVAEKEIVYKQFPIPLLNRLEKHILSTSSMMNQSQITLAKKLDEWAQDFTKLKECEQNKEFAVSF